MKKEDTFNPITFEEPEIMVEQMEETKPVLNTVKIPEHKSKIKKGIVTSPMLNVRELPHETANPFMILTEGIEVEIDKSFQDSKWFKIKTATGSTGYVVQEYIKVK